MISVYWTDNNAKKVFNFLDNEVKNRYEYALHRARLCKDEAIEAQRYFIESTKLIRNTMSEFYRKYTVYDFNEQ